jgi:hypothetical protein
MIKTKSATKPLRFLKDLNTNTISLVKAFQNVGTSRDFVFLWQEKVFQSVLKITNYGFGDSLQTEPDGKKQNNGYIFY